MPPHPVLEQLHQPRVHEGVVVGDIQADHPLAVQGLAEPTLQLRPMRPLHHEDQIGPRHELVGERRLRIMVRPRRLHLQIPPPREHLLRRGTAEAVLATDEEDALHSSAGSYLD